MSRPMLGRPVATRCPQVRFPRQETSGARRAVAAMANQVLYRLTQLFFTGLGELASSNSNANIRSLPVETMSLKFCSECRYPKRVMRPKKFHERTKEMGTGKNLISRNKARYDTSAVNN